MFTWTLMRTASPSQHKLSSYGETVCPTTLTPVTSSMTQTATWKLYKLRDQCGHATAPVPPIIHMHCGTVHNITAAGGSGLGAAAASAVAAAGPDIAAVGSFVPVAAAAVAAAAVAAAAGGAVAGPGGAPSGHV